MKRFFIRGTLIIFGVFLFFFSALATSEVLFLGDQQKSIALGKHFLFLQDNTKSLTIDNILSHKLDDRFQQGKRTREKVLSRSMVTLIRCKATAV